MVTFKLAGGVTVAAAIAVSTLAGYRRYHRRWDTIRDDASGALPPPGVDFAEQADVELAYADVGASFRAGGDRRTPATRTGDRSGPFEGVAIDRTPRPSGPDSLNAAEVSCSAARARNRPNALPD